MFRALLLSMLQILAFHHVPTDGVLTDSSIEDNNINEVNSNVTGYFDDSFFVVSEHQHLFLESMQAHQSFGKSHRFYYTLGERKDGKASYCK